MKTHFFSVGYSTRVMHCRWIFVFYVYAEVGHTDSGSENVQLLNCRLLKCDC